MFINNFISMLFPKQKPNKRTVNNIKNNFSQIIMCENNFTIVL